jgi:ankyrin repeat protein
VRHVDNEILRENLYKAALKTLAFKGMGVRRAAIEPAYAKTCQWIFETQSFQRWRDPALRNSHRGLYWIKGKPGSGKSTLMKCILERLERENGCKVVYFFFNARGARLEHSVEGCYRSLLYQMLQQVPALLTSLRYTDFPSDGCDWEIAVLKDQLREAMLRLQRENFVLMIDALDECVLEEVRDMVYFLDSLATSMELCAAGLSFCFASRHYPHVTVRSYEEMVLESEEFHTNDIHQYVEKNLNIEPDTHKHSLLEKLMRKAQGVFMWVKLVTRLLNEQFDQGTALEKLSMNINALPADLSTLIRQIIANGASDPCLLPTLLWTLAADVESSASPMDPDDFCFAVQFSAGKLTSLHRNGSLVDLGNPIAMKKFVLHSSKGLVEMVHDGSSQHLCYQFIHESIREYILHGGLADLRPDLGRKVEAASRATLVQWCQKYLRSDMWDYVDRPLDGSDCPSYLDVSDGSEVARQAEEAYPLLSYICCHMLEQIEAAYLGGCFSLHRLRTFPLQQWINMSNILVSQKWHLRPTASFLYLCLDAGLGTGSPSITRALLDFYPVCSAGSDAGTKGVDTIGHDFFNMLYGTSFDTCCGGKYGTPLVAAADRGSTAIVKMLLDLGAGVNVCADGSSRHRDCVGQNKQSVAELDLVALRKTACALSSTRTPLVAAVQDCDERLTLVKLLLTYGADINVRSGAHGNAFGSALYYGRWRTVSLLKTRGADINMTDSSGCNIAIRQAVEAPQSSLLQQERAPYIQLLIDSGAHAAPEAMNIFLHMAARSDLAEAPDIIETLVRAGANPRCRDIQNRTLLHTFAEGRGSHISTFRLILEFGIDVNALGGEYHTALIAASAKGNTSLVKLLLHYGADKSLGQSVHADSQRACRAL